MSKDFFSFLSPFAYASERDHCYPLYVIHCPLNMFDNTVYFEIHNTDFEVSFLMQIYLPQMFVYACTNKQCSSGF